MEVTTGQAGTLRKFAERFSILEISVEDNGVVIADVVSNLTDREAQAVIELDGSYRITDRHVNWHE